MTDTIGWGDVDVEPQRRRRNRRIALVAWPLLALVVAAVVLTPVARGRLSDGSVRWLQHEWAFQAAYDAARVSLLDAAEQELGVGDVATFVQLIHVVDRQEADRLDAVRRSVTGHHVWGGDASRARTAVVRALAGISRDLRTEAATISADDMRVSAYVPNLLSVRTQELVLTAGNAVAGAARAHHVRATRPPVVRLDAAGPVLARLGRVTDTPLALHLVLLQPNGVVSWDLRTGTSRVLQHAALTIDSGASALPLVAGRLLVSAGGFWLVPVDGSPLRKLPTADAYSPDGAGDLWRLRGLVLQRVSVRTGAVIGPPHRVPAGYDVQLPTQPGVIVLQRFVPDSPVAGQGVGLVRSNVIWQPGTGALTPINDSCDVVAAAASLVAYVSCDQTRIVVLDYRSHRRWSTPLPQGASAGTLVLSPDGRRLAFATSTDGDAQLLPSHLWVVDLRTHRTSAIVDDVAAAPVAWSPDGQTLIAQQVTSSGPCCADALAYWQPGMTGLAGIRINMAAVQAQAQVGLAP